MTENSATPHITHIGIVVRDMEKAVREWTERYGFKVVDELWVDVEGLHSVFVSPGNSRTEGFTIELMEPTDPDNLDGVVARRLAERGEGFFHLAMWTEDPPAVGEQLRGHGAVVIDVPPPGEGEPPRVIVHPKTSNGVLVELYGS